MANANRTRSPEETRKLAASLATGLGPHSVIALDGPLGAGKTEFVKGLAEGLGCTDIPTSPTFAIAHEYPGGRHTLFHFDFYRMSDSEEVMTCGLEDCIGAGVVVVEWAEKFSGFLPPGALRVAIDIADGDERMVSMEGGQ